MSCFLYIFMIEKSMVSSITVWWDVVQPGNEETNHEPCRDVKKRFLYFVKNANFLIVLGQYMENSIKSTRQPQ